MALLLADAKIDLPDRPEQLLPQLLRRLIAREVHARVAEVRDLWMVCEGGGEGREETCTQQAKETAETSTSRPVTSLAAERSLISESFFHL